MKANSKITLLILGLVALFLATFQNCSKVKVSDLTDEASKLNTEQAVPGPVLPKDCSEAGKLHGDKWWVPDGSISEPIQCAAGIGTQFRIFDKEAELTCNDGVVNTTGQTRRQDTGRLEGQCNLSCGDKTNGQMWWMDLPNQTEEKKCATSLTATQLLTYRVEAEYKCMNAIASATGDIKKTLISETECPTLSFNNKDHIATVAYEDILTGRDADSDYNDFVANIEVHETYNSLEQLTKIQVEYTPRMKLAGFPAQFVLGFDGQIRGRGNFVSNVKDFKSLPMFEGSASIKMETFQGTQRTSLLENIPKDKDLIIFSDTTAAVRDKPRARITVTNIDPQLNTLASRGGLSIKRYRTVLAVTNTYYSPSIYYDVDLSDINPTMFDPEKKPMAFFVPVDWKPPAGEVHILQPYPLFGEHAAYLYSQMPPADEPTRTKEWYNTLARPDLVLQGN